MHPEGRRYGDEVIGSRQSGWGEGQSRDFQQTAPFVALASERPPAEIASFAPRHIKRTALGDNDAGVRTSYANFAERTGMVEWLRHLPPDTYRRVVALARDFEARGPLHEQVRKSFGLSAADFARIASHVDSAAATLRANCRDGRLRFDLDPEAVVLRRAPVEAKLDCERP